MVDFSQAMDAAKLILSSSSGNVVTLIGVCLVATGCVLSYLLMSAPPEQSGPGRRLIVLLVLLSGIGFSVAGPAMSLYQRWDEAQRRAPDISSPEEEIEKLRRNTRVTRLIRLVVYNPTRDPDLSAAKLERLGRASQRYTFVADYEALRGRTVAEAVRMSGLRLDGGDRVSLVIFPLSNERRLFPVNARGLLQVIEEIERDPTVVNKFNVPTRLGAAAQENLKIQETIGSWAYDEYKQFYPAFCEVAHQFRCEKSKYSASEFMGNLSEDWNPLGFARKTPLTSSACALRPSQACGGAEWQALKSTILQDFGSRVFLTENADIAKLDGRIVMDVDQPAYQKIPIIPQ